MWFDFDLCRFGSGIRWAVLAETPGFSRGLLRSRAVGPESGPKHPQTRLAGVFIDMRVTGSAPGGFGSEAIERTRR